MITFSDRIYRIHRMRKILKILSILSNIMPPRNYSGGAHFYACNDSRKRKNCHFWFS